MNQRIQKKIAKRKLEPRKPIRFQMIYVSDSELSIVPLITSIRFRRYGRKR